MTNHDASQPTADSGTGDPRLHRFEDEERRPYRDPRDATDVDLDAVNNRLHYALYAVYCLVAPLPALEDTRRRLVGESNFFVDQSEVTTRGWYDVAGFRSDADLMIWWLDDDPEKLQDASHRLRASALGRYLEPVWSCMGLHTSAIPRSGRPAGLIRTPRGEWSVRRWPARNR